MKKCLTIVVSMAILGLAPSVFSSHPADEAERAAIGQAVLDHDGGWLEEHVERVDRALALTLPTAACDRGDQRVDSPQASSAASAAREAERLKVAEVISSVIGWAKDKNLDLFYGSIANDEDYISVSPGKRVIKRFEDVKQNVPFWMSPDFQYVRHELKDLEITFARCGTVAWFFCILDDINTYKGEPASWENARWTGVVEKRDGRWVVVSQHFSFASDK